ncbi:MAG: 50S ribosomal protein L11 methyltransferase [Dysgonamonadaceae bacterium]|nr:50S ribosomal protein L11 methyltransferase [Dysgonamonadaceae bacterium]MDD3309458.1 50S ribosomal protein L11 methyltransferase [Dysgonamonadaceae bacterium]MDD3900043.1 50S ribosomal protein L11 methyltransferase [Dysgonamonadaceae bacterium]MDD4398793.1 50S ribosomal protein L11 methyltransferase [Dysgonamonadaceae bacterium]
MKYLKVSFSCLPNTEVITDVLASDLAEIGYETFVTTEIGLDAYVPESAYSEERALQVIQDFILESEITFSSEELEDKDWNEEWEKHYFQPIVIDNDCIIRSTFHKIEGEYKYQILIDPKMAFGTGHHQTTGLILREILKMELQGKSVLDMGCGTAVLAILASMKGADSITGIDIDDWAYKNAIENVRLNNVKNIKLMRGGAELLGDESYEVIFANINRNILLRDIPLYAKAMNHNAKLIMSGFYKEDIPAIQLKCEEVGLTYSHFNELDNWVTLVVG